MSAFWGTGATALDIKRMVLSQCFQLLRVLEWQINNYLISEVLVTRPD